MPATQTPGVHPLPTLPTSSGVTQPPRPPVRNDISVKAQQLLIYLYTFVAIILTFRFILALVGAREETPFVNFVYSMSIPFMIPFSNMFGTPLAVQRYRLEFEVLVALLVYAILFFGVAKLVSIIFD